MKILAILLAVCSLQLGARGYSQGINLSVSNSPLEKVFKVIEQQSKFRFVYSKEALALSKPVTVNVSNGTIDNVLKLCFADQRLTYVVDDRFIIVKIGEERTEKVVDLREVRGRVVNESGVPLPGITILVKGSPLFTSTNADGEFSFPDLKENAILIVSGAELNKIEINIEQQRFIQINVQQRIGLLDETIIKGYYTTSKRLNTGTVGKVNSTEINLQPVSNPLAALQGRVPGLFITQSNGLPGSNFTVLIRGKNSIQQGNSPLFILDGIPFPSEKMNQSSLINAGNPFNTINPQDIESIEVLKDADATAIYGSRGANGVIIITTKSGKFQKRDIAINFYTGWTSITRTMKYLSIADYIMMRREAFSNDGVVPTINNAPDLLVWDSSRNTNWKKEMIGSTASTTDFQFRYADGNANTRFSLSTNYHKETTVFPGDFFNRRFSALMNLNHISTDKNMKLNFTAGFANESNNLISQDFTSNILLAPNYPVPYDSIGRLRWIENGVPFTNAYGILQQRYNVETSRFTSHVNFSYAIDSNFQFSTSAGFNDIHLTENSQIPIASLNPSNNPKGSAKFGNTDQRTWIIEPQLKYQSGIKKGFSLETILGGTIQQTAASSQLINGSGYINDNLIKSISGAASITSTNENSIYRYQAIYARVFLNYENRYLLNLTGRRDGSSRFGPGKQFANFTAAGLAWIFSKEQFFPSTIKWLSFGKLKFSIGLTGNDQISNYQYLQSWQGTTFPYSSIPGIRPTRLYNPDYGWETNRKLEGGIELGLNKDKIYLSLNYFNNRSGNQIINYPLPSQTGFSAVIKNFPGVVSNKGFEIQVNAELLSNKNFNWRSQFNFTSNRNKLVDFPGLSSSTYANTYRTGQPLNLSIGYHFLGVDPATGVYKFADYNNDNIVNSADYIVIGSTDPKFYGGYGNTFQFKGIQLDFFFQFIHQQGNDAIYGNVTRPGRNTTNQYTAILNRWRKPGDISPYQKYTATIGTPAYVAGGLIINSDAVFTNASFARLKNFSVSYQLSLKGIKGKKLDAKIYLHGQNLLTITRYKGPDPEVQNIQQLPPMKVIAAGFQLNL